MNVTALIGTKLDQKQSFLEDGTRVPVSLISIGENIITQVKTVEKDGYTSIQIGQGSTTKAKNPINGMAKKAGLEKTPRFLREIRVDDNGDAVVGSNLKVEEVFAIGDIVNVAGTSKGKGYAGVMKRHGFHGGPKTHGQSDRHRAPGSIGQSATPGRVYKGKRMAGRMGNERVTVRNLLVLDIVDGVLYVKGLIPGPKGTLIEIKKVGEDKKYIPLFKKADETVAPEASEVTEEPTVEAATPEAVNEASVTEEITPETTQEDIKEAQTDDTKTDEVKEEKQPEEPKEKEEDK